MLSGQIGEVGLVSMLATIGSRQTQGQPPKLADDYPFLFLKSQNLWSDVLPVLPECADGRHRTEEVPPCRANPDPAYHDQRTRSVPGSYDARMSLLREQDHNRRHKTDGIAPAVVSPTNSLVGHHAAPVLRSHSANRWVQTGKKAEANYWGEGATTLEWTLSSPPPFHQFETLPVIEDDKGHH